LRFSILVTLVLGIAGVLFAYYWTKAQAPLYINNIAPGDVKKIVGQLEQALQLNVPNLSFGYIFLHNLQAILVAMLIGFASFGIGGMVVFLINAGVIGGVLGIANVIGFSPLGVFAVGILPHGIFELSAVILTSAAVLHMGVTLVTPDSNLTIGQVFIETFADWLKILVGLALPLLVIAALIETYITPLIIAYFI
jgi:stage II sporulation protein M